MGFERLVFNRRVQSVKPPPYSAPSWTPQGRLNRRAVPTPSPRCHSEIGKKRYSTAQSRSAATRATSAVSQIALPVEYALWSID